MPSNPMHPKWATALDTEWCTACGRSILKGALGLHGPEPERVRCETCGNEALRAERKAALHAAVQ